MRPSRRRRGAYRGGGNEAIASARNRFDQARVARIVVKHRPQIADSGLQHRVADELVAPDLIQQGVLGEEGCRLPHQRAQHGEWRWSERDGLSVADQRHIRFVQLEPSKRTQTGSEKRARIESGRNASCRYRSRLPYKIPPCV